jgi:hypothetical protein
MAVQPLPSQPHAEGEDRAAFVDAYVQEVHAIPQVAEVRVRDDAALLDIYTVYSGDLAVVEHNIYDAELRVTDSFPHVRVDFHLVGKDFSVLDALRASTQDDA